MFRPNNEHSIIRPAGGSRFTISNRMIDEGHWMGLSDAEKALWFALWRYADRNDETYVSVETLAEKLGIVAANVSKTMAKLIDKGYVVNFGPRPCKGRSQWRRLTIPSQHMAPSAMRAVTSTVGANDLERMAQANGTDGATAIQHMAPSAIPTEGTENNRTSTGCDDAIAKGKAEIVCQNRVGELVAELTSAGVKGVMLSRLSRRKDLLPAAIRILHYLMPKGTDNPGGWIVSQIRHEEHLKISPLSLQRAAELIRHGDIISIAGYEVRAGFVTQNKGLYVHETDVRGCSDFPAPVAVIPASELTIESIKLSPLMSIVSDQCGAHATDESVKINQGLWKKSRNVDPEKPWVK